MKYNPSFDGEDRADFTMSIRLTKKEVEKVRRYLIKTKGRGLDIDVHRFITEMGSSTASDDVSDWIERLKGK